MSFFRIVFTRVFISKQSLRQSKQKVHVYLVPDVVADDDDDEEDEEELVDPLDVVREQCSRDAESLGKNSVLFFDNKRFNSILALLAELQTCTDRVESRNMTEETCQQVFRVLSRFAITKFQEQFDFLGHRDHCVAHHIFHHLK